ncbi:hypothetical protein D3C80_792920 [compost metagenome]
MGEQAFTDQTERQSGQRRADDGTDDRRHDLAGPDDPHIRKDQRDQRADSHENDGNGNQRSFPRRAIHQRAAKRRGEQTDETADRGDQSQ